MFIYIYCNSENLIYNYFKKRFASAIQAAAYRQNTAGLMSLFFNVNVLRERSFNIHTVLQMRLPNSISILWLNEHW